MTDTADLLAGVPLLSGLDRKQLASLARDFTERTFPAGSVVVRQGDEQGDRLLRRGRGRRRRSRSTARRSGRSGRGATSVRWPSSATGSGPRR